MILSILTMYNYDDSLFNNFTLPEPIPTDVKQTCIEDICSQLAEFSVAYPDLDTMRYMIGVWSKKNQYTWKTLYNTTVQEYNPIENYNRIEEFTTANNAKSDAKTTSTINSKLTAMNTVEQESNKNNSTFNAGYNTENAQLAEKTESIDNGYINNSTNSTEHTGNTIKNSGENSTSETRTGKIHGNIGVTTTQRMLQAEREIAMFSFVDSITASFKNEFCIMVY